MKKNKTILSCMVIMLSACLVQPICASTPSASNDAFYLRGCIGAGVGIAGLYALGRYFEKKKPSVSSNIAGCLLVSSMPGLVLIEAIKKGNPAIICWWAYIDSLTWIMNRSLPVTKTIFTVGSISLCAFYAAIQLDRSLGATAEKIRTVTENKEYQRLTELLLQKPGWATVDLGRESVVTTIVKRCNNTNIRQASLPVGVSIVTDADMLGWLSRLSEESRVCVEREIRKSGSQHLKDWYKSLSKDILAKGYGSLIGRKKLLPLVIINKISDCLVSSPR